MRQWLPTKEHHAARIARLIRPIKLGISGIRDLLGNITLD